MKYLVKFFVVTLFLIFCTAVTAEDNIVVLDLTYVLNNSKAGKGAQDFLKKSFKDSTQKYSDMEEALKKEEQDLLTKKTVLSKEEYVKKSDALRKKVIDYQSQRRASVDKIATLRTESRQRLIDSINPILEIYIKDNNISLVIDKKSTLQGKPETDITKIITEKLDKVLPSLNLK